MYGLGINLTPPRWLRDLGARVLSQTRVVVPTPFGDVTIDPSSAADVARVRAMLQGARVTYGQTSAGLPVASLAAPPIPGGWLTIAGLGVVALFVLGRASARGRS